MAEMSPFLLIRKNGFLYYIERGLNDIHHQLYNSPSGICTGNRKEGIRHIVREVDELQIPGFAKNPPERCYLCKRVLMQTVCETDLSVAQILRTAVLKTDGTLFV